MTRAQDACIRYELRTCTVQLQVRETCEVQLTSTPMALPILRAWFDTFDADRETFAALFLDARGRPIGSHVHTVGILTASLVHPRELFRPAILAGAVSILLAHNHPSGDPEPSPEDLAITCRLVEVGQLLGIPVSDHVILAAGSTAYTSWRERGYIL